MISNGVECCPPQLFLVVVAWSQVILHGVPPSCADTPVRHDMPSQQLLSWTAGYYSSTASCLDVSCQSRLPGINIALPKPFDMHHHAHSSVGTVLIMLHQGTHGHNVITRQVLHTHSRCLKGNLPTAFCSKKTQPSKDNNHNAGPARACVCIVIQLMRIAMC